MANYPEIVTWMSQFCVLSALSSNCNHRRHTGASTRQVFARARSLGAPTDPEDGCLHSADRAGGGKEGLARLNLMLPAWLPTAGGAPGSGDSKGQQQRKERERCAAFSRCLCSPTSTGLIPDTMSPPSVST